MSFVYGFLTGLVALYGFFGYVAWRDADFVDCWYCRIGYAAQWPIKFYEDYFAKDRNE